MIVIGDVHGRTFWKDAIEGKENELIVFLGDYLDPYSYEGISFDEAFANFEQIIEFKKKHKDNVILLLGNHDCHYIDITLPCSRFDNLNANQIKKLFTDNIELFQLVFEKKINGKNYIFSHAGILSGWVKHNPMVFKNCESTKIVSLLNALFIKNNLDLTLALDDVHFKRGGSCHYGSMVWADLSEFENETYFLPNTYQIFGHTQQEKHPVIKKNYACLDCRKAFYIDDKGNIKPSKLIDKMKIKRMISQAFDDDLNPPF